VTDPRTSDASAWTRTVSGPLDFGGASAAHEQLLRAGGPAVHVAVVAARGVSFGVGESPDPSLVDRAKGEGLPVLRRTSGGTGIVHLEGDLVWGIVLPRKHPAVVRGFVREYARLGAGVAELLRRGGRAAAWRPAPGIWDPYCPLGHRGSVLEMDDMIVGAAAQHATSTAVLHHGLLSVRVDRPLVARVFAFPHREWADRLGGTSDAGVRLDPAGLADALVSAIDTGA
jgi:lipoate-protein ligase A